jgi:hypothetical protein
MFNFDRDPGFMGLPPGGSTARDFSARMVAQGTPATVAPSAGIFGCATRPFSKHTEREKAIRHLLHLLEEYRR